MIRGEDLKLSVCGRDLCQASWTCQALSPENGRFEVGFCELDLASVDRGLCLADGDLDNSAVRNIGPVRSR